MTDLRITTGEREYLRGLAARQAELAALPVMKERERRWYAHNACQKGAPMVVVELGSFSQDLWTPQCETPLARDMERRLMSVIVPAEKIDDDLVVDDRYLHGLDVRCKDFGGAVDVRRATDTKGRNIGYQFEHIIKNITEDMGRLAPFEFSFNKKEEALRAEAVCDVIGDLLTVVPTNEQHTWYNMPTAKVIQLMGLEQWMFSMLDEPEAVHALMRFITDGCKNFFKWQESEGLLTMNNGNHYTGAGSRGFSDELTMPADGRVRTKDIWINTNSQESSAISPAMYAEFVYPYLAEIAEMYGLVYYGCCEAVDSLWEVCLKNLPNLRKVSISAWCDEEKMGEALRGGRIIYSRKPSPHFLGVDPVFDEEGYREHIKHTLLCARGCTTEIIFRDVYTLMGDPGRPARAVRILRELVDKYWQ